MLVPLLPRHTQLSAEKQSVLTAYPARISPKPLTLLRFSNLEAILAIVASEVFIVATFLGRPRVSYPVTVSVRVPAPRINAVGVEPVTTTYGTGWDSHSVTVPEPPKNPMAGQVTDTTPLLRAKNPMLPGSGPFPALGQYPNARFIQSQYQGYNRANGGEVNRVFHDGDLGKDPHSQFCALTGCPPTNAPAGFKYKLNDKTLYGRAQAQVSSQNFTYQLTAALTNTLLLLQIVLGAALTGLGGSGVPSWVITLFGATNTVIAGLVAYLKSRGQPMRARMFRDDLERVVDEIENSEVMWLGIAKGVHGYADIDTDIEVTVRSEVARLTRLLDKAIRNNTANNPDLYSTTALTSDGAGGQNRGPFLTLPAMPPAGSVQPNQPTTPAAKDADAAPATSASSKKLEEAKKKKEEEDKAAAEKKKQEEAKAEGSKTTATTTSTSEDKGKTPETLTSIAGKAQETFASMGGSKLFGSGGDGNSSSSVSKTTTTKSSGGSDGNKTTTTTTTDGDGTKVTRTISGSGRQPALEEA